MKVGFIDFEDDETDLGLSLAVYDGDQYIDSVMLARSVFDRLMDESEQGVKINYSPVLGDPFDPILLQEARIDDEVLELVCPSHRFELDVSRLEPSDITTIKHLLKKLNQDNRYKLSIVG